MHELCHDINLPHNDNDDPISNVNFSTVHASETIETRPMPAEPAAQRLARAERRLASLQSRGLEEGKQFVRSHDGERFYSVCR